MKIPFRDHQFITMAALFCMALLLGGCVTAKKRDRLFAKKPAAAEEPAPDADQAEPLEVGAPLKAFRINPDYGWVVVKSAETLIPGMKFSAWHGEEETARLVVDERSRHPYYILEVEAGNPHPNDTYTPTHSN